MAADVLSRRFSGFAGHPSDTWGRVVEADPQCDDQVSIRILGTPEVCVGARCQDPLGLGIWLLGSLAPHPGQLVSERRLIELVWGCQGASTSALRSAVSRPRSALREYSDDSVAIEHLNHGYRLSRLDRVRIDATYYRCGTGRRGRGGGAGGQRGRRHREVSRAVGHVDPLTSTDEVLVRSTAIPARPRAFRRL